MALVQVTVTAVLVFDDAETAGPDPSVILELFEPPEPGQDMVVPVMAKVSSPQVYLGAAIEGFACEPNDDHTIVVAGAVGNG
jgi:hypothetical protein